MHEKYHVNALVFRKMTIQQVSILLRPPAWESEDEDETGNWQNASTVDWDKLCEQKRREVQEMQGGS